RDIGLAAEAVLRHENGPCVVFDEVPGSPKGFRVLMNVFAGKRRNMTLGLPDHLNKWELSDAYRKAYLTEQKSVPHVIVDDGPVFSYGGTKAPYGVFELDLVGGLRGRPVEMVRGRLTGLPFPANAEIVLEGFVSPDKRRHEGPFGEWTGYYNGGTDLPVVDIKA